MKQRSLKILAFLCLFVLLTFTGCSAVGGFNGFAGGCVGCFFEKLGCSIDCLLKFEPVYCLSQNCLVCTNDDHEAVTCDDCYEGCLVTPCFDCAVHSQSDCIRKNKEQQDVIFLLSGTFGESDMTIAEDYRFLRITVTQSYTGSDNATCDGDYQRCETTVTVENKGPEDIKNALIEITKNGVRQACVIGNIPAYGSGEATHYQYFRQDPSPDSSLDGCSYSLYGTVLSD